MNKQLFIGLSATFGIGILIILAIVSFNSVKTEASNVNEPTGQADKVQVYLFHATQRCMTCITIGRLTGETVAEYFQSETRDGKIEFREVNIDLPENRALADKYQASGSALYINAIKDGQDSISEDVTVWRLTSNEIQFKGYLKDKLNKLLGK